MELNTVPEDRDRKSNDIPEDTNSTTDICSSSQEKTIEPAKCCSLFVGKHSCYKYVFVFLLAALCLSMLLPFVMIPIAFRIRDKTLSTIIPTSTTSDLVKLTTIDGLWFWMVTAASATSNHSNTVQLVLSDRLETVWMNSSNVTYISSNTSQLTLLENAYILPGSVIAVSPDNNTTVTLAVVQFTDTRQNVTVCSEHICTINQTGYYSALITTRPSINTTIAYQYSIRSIKATYYNTTISSFLYCTLDRFNKCRFELDDLTEYHLLATLNTNQSADSVIKLTVEGRLTWYCVIILLIIPLLIIVLALICLIKQ